MNGVIANSCVIAHALYEAPVVARRERLLHKGPEPSLMKR